MPDTKVVLYTDGACSGNPGIGGWGAILMCGEHKRELSGFAPATTNNRMEIMAVLMGLKALNVPCEVDVYSDSTYVVNAFVKNWLKSWSRNNWIKSDKKPVLNRDLWEELLGECAKHVVRFHHVRGHSTNVHNNRCDTLATQEIKKHRENHREARIAAE